VTRRRKILIFCYALATSQNKFVLIGMETNWEGGRPALRLTAPRHTATTVPASEDRYAHTQSFFFSFFSFFLFFVYMLNHPSPHHHASIPQEIQWIRCCCTH